jgi:hypothetical protein
VRNDPTKGGVIQVDGTKFLWSIAHKEGHANTGGGQKGIVGLAILVRGKDVNRRHLLLQFEPTDRYVGRPQRPYFRIPDRRLTECIQNAIAAAWDPESRGKEFVFQAGLLDHPK